MKPLDPNRVGRVRLVVTPPKCGGVYLIYDVIDGIEVLYIGESEDVIWRWQGHIRNDTFEFEQPIVAILLDVSIKGNQKKLRLYHEGRFIRAAELESFTLLNSAQHPYHTNATEGLDIERQIVIAAVGMCRSARTAVAA